MSFSHLQKQIKRLKSPLAVCLSPTLEQLPPCISKTQGETPEESAQALLTFDLALLEALQDVAPAVWLQVAPFLSLGWQGMKAMETVLHAAREKGFFVIADLPLLVAENAPLAARSFLSAQGTFDLDCVVINGYCGSDGIRPVLDLCRQEDKCLFVQVRTSNPSGFEIQDLVAGDRVVHQAMGDLVQRLGREEPGLTGYTRAGALVGLSYPSDLRTLRKRLEQTFFLIPNYGHGLTAEDARFAFDQYGRGALLSDGGACLSAWQAEGCEGKDFAAAARSTAQTLQNDIRQYVTFL